MLRYYIIETYGTSEHQIISTKIIEANCQNFASFGKESGNICDNLNRNCKTLSTFANQLSLDLCGSSQLLLISRMLQVMTVCLQNSASIKPRTGFSKFANNQSTVRKTLEQTQVDSARAASSSRRASCTTQVRPGGSDRGGLSRPASFSPLLPQGFS